MEGFAHVSELGTLAGPNEHTEALSLPAEGPAPATLVDGLKRMIRIRIVEEVIADLVEEGLVKCPCHLGIGQEAIGVGVGMTLTPRDRVFGGHRSHSHYLGLGGSVEGLLAEVLGRETGCSQGRGGSMHLVGGEVGFVGSVPLVGATIPLAVGAALAARLDEGDAVAVTYFGDGAAEEGVLHESLNLAAVMRLPVLFVCENNLFSSHLDIKLRQPTDRVARYAEAHRMPAAVIDGNDLVEVAATAGGFVDAMRRGGGPAFLETVTYRWRGHVGPKEDIDVGVRRSMTEVMAWRRRDPIERLAAALVRDGHLSRADVAGIEQAERTATLAARDAALADPLPDPATVLDHVYHTAPAQGGSRT